MVITPTIDPIPGKPLTTCPKCGSEEGRRGPRFRVGMSSYSAIYNDPDTITFSCNTCGYTHHQKPLDAQ